MVGAAMVVIVRGAAMVVIVVGAMVAYAAVPNVVGATIVRCYPAEN